MKILARTVKEISTIGVADDGNHVIIQFADTDGKLEAIAVPRDQSLKLVELGAAASARARKLSSQDPMQREIFTVRAVEIGHTTDNNAISLTITFATDGVLTFAMSRQLAHSVYEGLELELGLSKAPPPPERLN